MNRYRVIMTFEAKDNGEAAAIAARPERLPREARIVVENLGERRTVRLAVCLGLTIAFWLAVASGLTSLWRTLP